jgi:stearoyl-CoA desaturase (delta-9 desaturase)
VARFQGLAPLAIDWRRFAANSCTGLFLESRKFISCSAIEIAAYSPRQKVGKVYNDGVRRGKLAGRSVIARRRSVAPRKPFMNVSNPTDRIGDPADEFDPRAATLARAPAARRASAPGAGPRTMSRPPASEPVRIYWNYAISVTLVHGLALLVLLPYCFSWSGVVLCVLGLYVFGTLGINLGYHRLLTHGGLKVPAGLEYALAVLGMCCLEDSPARWVAMHRMHHRDSDEVNDPHSPLAGFLWGHMGWLFVKSRDHDAVRHFERYARDLLRNPFYLRLERRLNWLWVYAAHAAVFFVAGLAWGLAATGDPRRGLQCGVSLLVWGVVFRTVLVWHITWSVNSLSHLWGYQSYGTGDQSRNNWFVALVSNGEGWHNNHHYHPRSAAHGHRWWELDVTWMTILFLEQVGLAKDVVRPRRLQHNRLLSRAGREPWEA